MCVVVPVVCFLDSTTTCCSGLVVVTAALPEVFLEARGPQKVAELLDVLVEPFAVLDEVVRLAAGIIVLFRIRRATRDERHQGASSEDDRDINTDDRQEGGETEREKNEDRDEAPSATITLFAKVVLLDAERDRKDDRCERQEQQP